MEFLLLSRKNASKDTMQSAVRQLGVNVTKMIESGKGLSLDVIAGSVYTFMDKVFEPSFYDLYSVHIAKDEDDQPPESRSY